MGYGWGCKLAVVSLVDSENMKYEDIEAYMQKIADAYKNKFKESGWLPKIGKKYHGSAGNYSCGGLTNTKEVVTDLIQFAREFPDVVFSLHHFYWDFSSLTIYTFSKDGILQDNPQIDLENLMVGKHRIGAAFSFNRTTCDNDISMFFTSGYRFDFEWNGKYIEQEKQLNCGLVPVLPPPYSS